MYSNVETIVFVFCKSNLFLILLEHTSTTSISDK